MNDYKEMREGKILLNRFPYIECKDFRRQEQHEKENQYFLTNENGFFVKKYLAEKYQDKIFEFVTECVPKVEEHFEHVSLSDIRKQKEKEASIKEDALLPQKRRRRGR